MNAVLAVAQGLGVLAVLLGVVLLLPVAVALMVDGALVVAVGVAVELVMARRGSS